MLGPVLHLFPRGIGSYTDKDYTIHVDLPNCYDLQATTVYPVVYLLDAQWYWDWLPGTEWYTGAGDLIDTLSRYGYIPPVILVGIDTGSTEEGRHNTLVIDSPRCKPAGVATWRALKVLWGHFVYGQEINLLFRISLGLILAFCKIVFVFAVLRIVFVAQGQALIPVDAHSL